MHDGATPLGVRSADARKRSYTPGSERTEQSAVCSPSLLLNANRRFKATKPSVCNRRTRGSAGADIWGSLDRCPSARSERTSSRAQFGSGASTGNRSTIQRGAVPFLRLPLIDRLPSHSQDSAWREPSTRKRLKARLMMPHFMVCLKAYPDTNLEFFRRR